MVVTESEMGELESALQSDQQAKNSNHHFSSLGRQSSIYSLTLDEFQHTLCESGIKDFGSMNMDEFLTSIWTAEENQANSTNYNNRHNSSNNHITNASQGLNDAQHRGSVLSKQPSLPGQGSLTLPALLYRKTVDEVWSEIHKEQQHIGGSGGGSGSSSGGNVRSAETAPRQRTFGEMTLEDFLFKAGVVREQCTVPSPPHQQQYELYQNSNNNPAVGTGFVSRPISIASAVGGGGGGGCAGGVSYQSTLHGTGGIGESSGGNGGYQPTPTAAPAAVYGGRVGNGGGYGPGQGMGVVGPVSPVSSDGMVAGGNRYGMDMSGLRGRKRIIDGPVEKVVERRQRRMIKNRESAARSRARKQAYTVELEAELNQLKEENKLLKLALAELDRKRKQQYLEELRMKTQTKAQKAKEKLRLIRRNFSCPL